MKSRTPATTLWLILTNLMLGLSVCMCAYCTFIFFNPQSALNLLPPPTRTPRPFPTLPPELATPTPSASPEAGVTATGILTLTPPATETGVTEAPPTSALTNTPTPTPLGPSATISATENNVATSTPTPIPPATNTPSSGYPGNPPVTPTLPGAYP